MALGSRRACADTLEPWPDCHKPLVAYLLIGFVNLLLGLFLELHGFELQRVGRLAYWARPARESMLRPPPPPPMPLVVLHGVLGLLPYALMLRQLSREHDGAVLAPLFPHCAVQLEHLCSALPPPLDATELVATIRSMVARYTHVESAVQASFVAHSLGTGYLALLCRRAPELPAAVAFIDPICFLLPDGHVLRNYLYQPVTLGLSTWFHWLQRYLVADEPTQQDYFRNIFWWASSWIHPSELRASAHHGALSSPPQVGVLMASPVRAAVRCARSALGTRLSRVCAQRVHTPQGLARLAWTDHWTVRCKRSPWRSNGPWRSPWRSNGQWTVRRKRVTDILGADATALAPGAVPWLAALRPAAASPHACELDPWLGALFPTRAEHPRPKAAAHGRQARRDQSCGRRRPSISAVAAQPA